jgi:hypothetical protein
MSAGGTVQPGTVRAIEYEIVSTGQASRIGLGGTSLAGELHAVSELGVLRCVDHLGKKLTVVGQAGHVRKLLASGEATDPRGMALKEQLFPVAVNGWIMAQ